MRNTLAALAILAAASPAYAQLDPAVLQESLVQVVAMDANGVPRRARSGFAVSAAGHVLTAAHGIANEDRIVVVPLDSGAELLARVVHADQRADVALLHANGLAQPPLPFAKDGFAPGRVVFSAGIWGERGERLFVADAGGGVPAATSAGAVGRHGEIAAARSQPALALLLHNAMIPAAGYGGPVLNECGEVAGVNRGDPDARSRQLRQGLAPDAVVHAAAASSVAELLQPFLPTGVSFTQSEASCAEGRAAAKAEAEAAASKAGEAEAQAQEAARLAEQKDADLAERQAALDAAEARLAELQAQSDEAARTGAAQADSLRTDLDAARGEREAAQTAVREREEELARLQAEREADAETNRLLLIVLAAVALVAALVVAVLVVAQRRRAREAKNARQQAARAEREAAQAQEEAAQAQEKAERAMAEAQPPGPANDCLLTGETSAGQPVSLKVPGRLLGGEGAVIGRNPRNASLLVDDETLSREHARLRYDPQRGLLIEDLDSRNGIRLNGRPLPPRTSTRIVNGDIAELGGVKLHVAWAG